MRVITFILSLCFICKAFALSPDYQLEYLDYSQKKEQPCAVAIVAFNRPLYLKQLLDSLEKNPESQSIPFFFFLDGGPKATREQNIDLINKSKIKNKQIVIRDVNYGCPKNHIDSKRFLFDFCGFEKVIVIEEDIVVSKNYIRSLLGLHKWAKKTYANVGIVQMWTECFLSKSEKLKSLNEVRETDPFYSLVTYCMDKELWDAISPMLYTYEHTFIDPLLGRDDFSMSRSKPGFGIYAEEIKRWVVDTVFSSSREKEMQKWRKEYLPFLESKYDLREMMHSGRWCVSQDWMTSYSIWLSGSTRLQTIVNRVIHIGEEGITSYSGFWHELHHDLIILDEFSEGEDYIFKQDTINVKNVVVNEPYSISNRLIISTETRD